MNIKYIISLSVLIAFAGMSCWGASLCNQLTKLSISLIQQLVIAIANGNAAQVQQLTPAAIKACAFNEMPAEMIDKIAGYLDSSSLMNLATQYPPSYQVIKTMPSFQHLKQLIERHNNNLQEALFDAVKNNDTWPISYLIRRLNSNNATAKFSNAALLQAIRARNNNMVIELLNNGVNPNARNESGHTALAMATSANKNEIVKILLAHGADVDADNGYGWTALGWAARDNHPGIVDLLIAANADVEKAIQNLRKVGNNQEAIRLLEEKSANTPILKYDQKTLMNAIYRNQNNRVAQLLEGGVNPNTRDESGHTVLAMAAFANKNEIVKILLAHGADVDADNGYGWTALGWAARDNHPEIVDLLIAANADVEKAIQNLRKVGNNQEAVRLLEEKSANTPILKYDQKTLMNAIYRNQNNRVAQLLEGGVNPNTRDESGHTVLAMAAFANKNEIVKILLAHGADVDADNGYGWTALGWAARDDHPALVDLLIAANADVEKAILQLQKIGNDQAAIHLLEERVRSRKRKNDTEGSSPAKRKP